MQYSLIRSKFLQAFELSGKRPIEPAGSLFQSTIEGLITVIATDVNPLVGEDPYDNLKMNLKNETYI